MRFPGVSQERSSFDVAAISDSSLVARWSVGSGGRSVELVVRKLDVEVVPLGVVASGVASPMSSGFTVTLDCMVLG